MGRKRSSHTTGNKLAAGAVLLFAVVLLISRMGLLDGVPGGLPGARPAPPEADKLCSDAVPWREVWEEPEAYSGKTVAVTGTVAGAAFAPGIEGKPTFLNIGNPHPRTPRFELIIWEESRPAFLDSLPAPPERLFVRRRVCAAGTVRLHEGIPQIELRDPVQIRVVEE